MKHFDFSKKREKEIHVGKTAYMEEVRGTHIYFSFKKNPNKHVSNQW